MERVQESEIFIHLGLPRTGTTFLQTQVFPKIQNINYVGYIGFNTKLVKHKINLVSNDGLFGNAYFPDYDALQYEILDRVHNCFPAAKIIFVTRNISDWHNSLYKYYVTIGGTIENELDFFNDPQYKHLKSFDVHDYIAYMLKLFPDVFVIPFERLKEDPVTFVSKICEFIGVEPPEFENKKVNASLKADFLKRRLLLNRILTTSFKRGFIPYGLSLQLRNVLDIINHNNGRTF